MIRDESRQVLIASQIARRAEIHDLTVRQRADPYGGVGVRKGKPPKATDRSDRRKVFLRKLQLVDIQIKSLILAGSAEVTICKRRQVGNTGVGDIQKTQLWMESTCVHLRSTQRSSGRAKSAETSLSAMQPLAENCSREESA